MKWFPFTANKLPDHNSFQSYTGGQDNYQQTMRVNALINQKVQGKSLEEIICQNPSNK